MTKTITMTLFSKVTVKQGVIAVLLSLFLSGCASNHGDQKHLVNQFSQDTWMQDILNYRAIDDKSSAPLFKISDEMRQIVHEKFGHQRKSEAVANLAQWLMSEDGHNMSYDPNSNLLPIQTFEEKRGNCLSFTILLVNLAREIDIELDYNDVDLPSIWGLEEGQDNFILFRHVNAIRKSRNIFQIFDLAIDEYDFGFPQRIISEQQAAALFNSNLAIQSLNNNKPDESLHHIKLAISLDSSNPGFWNNLGVIYKSKNEFSNTERAFLTALEIDRSSSLAAINLEQLYTELGQTEKAKHFQKVASKARDKNPYNHYQQASDYVDKKRFRLAKKSITRAKRLHKQDPRFFVLSSVIEQHLDNDKSALKDMLTARKLTVDNEKKRTYSKKALILASAIQQSRHNNLEQSIWAEDSHSSGID